MYLALKYYCRTQFPRDQGRLIHVVQKSYGNMILLIDNFNDFLFSRTEDFMLVI